MNDRAHQTLAGVIMAVICGIVIYSSSLHLVMAAMP
jgi:hypothetical protein